MFKRTVDLFHRLVGKTRGTPSGQQAPDSDERRVRARFPSNVQVAFQLLDGSDGLRLTGRVSNISQSGVRLVIARPLEPGKMVSIELPGLEGQVSQVVLACVVHATPEPAGEWAVGCTFSHELSDEDLRAFGARREKPASPDDARGWVRFPVQVTASCQEVASPGQQPWPVQVLNISANGIGLVVKRPIEPGTLLTLDLHRDGSRVGQAILACVVHVNPQEGGEVALGCNFIRELTDAELKALI